MYPSFSVARASTAIGVSPIIKETVQKQAHSTRLTLKEVILMGMLAIDKLDDQSRQELADQVHQMQVNGEI
ncbi:hypothetical protein NIES4074_22580 [Cylindrospermum sp. NIES-4074]|jgi:hypothetical protein|nr:hypothetical protein NIES4074_22580 [Cylindrospermum sp. NIES-4074]